MQRIAVIAAMCLALAGVGAYCLGATSVGDVTHAQTGGAPPAAGTGGPMGPPAGMGAPGGAVPGAADAAAAAPAAPAITATRRPGTDLAEGEDRVADVVSPAILKLDKLGYVHLAGVTTPAEYFLLRSDYAKFEGATPEPGAWRRDEGARYETNEAPDDYTYRTGEEDLRLFVFETIINRKVKVEKVGLYVYHGASRDWEMPDVVLTFTRPRILTTDSTDPINLNEMVVAQSHCVPMHNCQWELGQPARFDATTQRWVNPKWNSKTGRVDPSLRPEKPATGTTRAASASSGSSGPSAMGGGGMMGMMGSRMGAGTGGGAMGPPVPAAASGGSAPAAASSGR